MNPSLLVIMTISTAAPIVSKSFCSLRFRELILIKNSAKLLNSSLGSESIDSINGVLWFVIILLIK